MKIDPQNILAGNQLAAARLITLLEEGEPAGVEILKSLYPHTGKAHIVGITGPAGTGKSTLASWLISVFRSRGTKVGVIAVDPSSPLSGGALLGDRVRMYQHESDEGVFIRSMAARGHLGGVNRATREAALVMDAMGCGMILVETVGAGQDEVEISQLAHTTIVVTISGMGDEIQEMKAGLLEIGDIIVVNKADLPGADDLVRLHEMMLDRRQAAEDDWRPPVLRTIAIKGDGVGELAETVLDHREYLTNSGRISQRSRARDLKLFRQIVVELLSRKMFNLLDNSPEFARLMASIESRAIDPYTAADRVVAGLRVISE
jgi:LAO/AO transport system kinase